MFNQTSVIAGWIVISSSDVVRIRGSAVTPAGFRGGTVTRNPRWFLWRNRGTIGEEGMMKDE